MRRIVKTHAPLDLTQWRKENKNSNHSYTDLSPAVYESLKKKLLREQGYLCAYTGTFISYDSSHIEHLKPQSKCDDWEDVEYRNVVACFPADGGDVTYGYGAPVKGKWWDDTLFVSPLSAGCEQRFRFVWSGHIHPCPSNHVGAIETIKAIALDHDTLRKLRKKRIDGDVAILFRTHNLKYF